MVEFFRNLFIGCCCSDNRVDKLSDMQTGPQVRPLFSYAIKRGGMMGGGSRQVDDYHMQQRTGG